MKTALRISLHLAAILGFASPGFGQGSMTRFTTPAQSTFGRNQSLSSPSTNGFTISAQRHFDNCVAVTVSAATRYWFRDFTAPSESLVAAGRYENATLWARATSARPVVAFARTSMSVPSDGGLFNATGTGYSPGSSIARFDTSFSRYDEGQLAAWIQSNIRFPKVDPVR